MVHFKVVNSEHGSFIQHLVDSLPIDLLINNYKIEKALTLSLPTATMI